MKESIDHDGKTMINFIKQSTQPRGQGSTKSEDPSPTQKQTNPKGVARGKGNKLCSRAPASVKKHIIKEREGKPENVLCWWVY